MWFNIGVPAFRSKVCGCQPYHGSLVRQQKGLVPSARCRGRCAVGTKVLDAHGVTRVVAVKAQRAKARCFGCTTKAGHPST